MPSRADIVIVVPPFAMASYPSLGPSILAAGCTKLDLSVDVFYANLLLAAQVGFELYEDIACSDVRNLLGEAIFQAQAFPSAEHECSETAVEAAFGTDATIRTTRNFEGISRDDVLLCVQKINAFLDEIIGRILDYRPKVVGLNTVFQQNLASVAVLSRLKEAAPALVTVLGGSNTAMPMGSALAELTDACDFLFVGEADLAFPGFCLRYLQTQELPSERVVECGTILDLDATPEPDYSAYFSQVSDCGVDSRLPTCLPTYMHFESSRGCWYGAKSHCRFCGLNGAEISYRKKSTERILSEVCRIVHFHRPKLLAATDNIMPLQFENEVLPRLQDEQLDVEFFYEVKANLRAEQLDQFALSGITMIQPGIESLSTNVLKNMAKGVPALQNIWLLRECQSRQIQVYWNLLTGIPGETTEDYESILAVVPMLEHLRPPSGVGEIRLDRYSPYFMQAQEFGIVNVRPFPIYNTLYPQECNVSDIAYHFTGDYTTEYLADERLQKQLKSVLSSWRSAWYDTDAPPRLFALNLGDDHLLIQDTRSCAIDTFYVASRPVKRTLTDLSRPTHRDRLSENRQAILQILLDRRFVIEHESHYLSVVTDPAKGAGLIRREGREVNSRNRKVSVA